MAIVASDLPATVSTQYEVWFLQEYNQTVAVTDAQLAPLLMDLTIGDYQGNRIDLNWLGGAPQLRKWVDEKRAQAIRRYNYSVGVERWEATMRIDLDALKDARWNIYEPRIREMGQNAARHSYVLFSALLQAGETSTGYDGQYFFDTDHVDGNSGVQSNLFSGTGVTLTNLTNDYYGAKAKLMTVKDDTANIWHPTTDFRPLVWIPADATLIQNFNTLKLAGLISSGSTNILVNDFDLVVDPSLTDQNDWYMFRTDLPGLKPMIRVLREGFHYEDNFGDTRANPDVWSRRFGEVSVVGRDSMTYGMWQGALKVKNT